MSEMLSATVTVPRYMTVKEVAITLRCSGSKVYALIYAGVIPTVKVAGKTLCRATDIQEYLTKCERDSGFVVSGEASSKPSDTSGQGGANDVLSRHRRSKRLTHSFGT